ncbi:Acetylesterase [Rhodotorula toruloides]|nr:Acetylesterase [Rhodotorula toruloides]
MPRSSRGPTTASSRLLTLVLLLIGCSAFRGVRAQAAPSIVLDDIDTIFAFGDSYSATGYKPALGVNNFPGMEGTVSGGYIWLQYLSTLNSSHPITLYDLAVSGATTDNAIVNNTSDDFNTQTATFSKYFSAPNGQALVTNQARWDPARTLFAVWMGINDIGRAYQNNQNLTDLIPAIFDQWNRNFAALYAGGARNFLVLGVPPTDQTPLVQSVPPAVPLFAAWVGQYNGEIASYANSLPSLFPGTSVFVFDTQPFFRALLASPRAYGFVDTTTYCEDYSVVQGMPNLTLPQCTWPMSEYVWWNNYHPTWAVHRLLANVIAEVSRLFLSQLLHLTITNDVLPLQSPSHSHTNLLLPLLNHLPLPLSLNTHHLSNRHRVGYSYGRSKWKYRFGRRDGTAKVGC